MFHGLMNCKYLIIDTMEVPVPLQHLRGDGCKRRRNSLYAEVDGLMVKLDEQQQKAFAIRNMVINEITFL